MAAASDNVMDKWILSLTNTLLKFVQEEMAGTRPPLRVCFFVRAVLAVALPEDNQQYPLKAHYIMVESF